MPIASYFTGKIIEIVDTRYTQPSSSNYVGALYLQQCNGTNNMKGNINGNPTNIIRLNGSQNHDGGNYRVLSYNNYWVRLSTIGMV